MPPKVQQDLSFTDTFKELKKFTNSLQIKLDSVMERIEHATEQEKIEHGKLRYELEKKRFKFTTHQLDELLNELIDIDKLWVYEKNVNVGFDLATKDYYCMIDF